MGGREEKELLRRSIYQEGIDKLKPISDREGDESRGRDEGKGLAKANTRVEKEEEERREGVRLRDC